MYTELDAIGAASAEARARRILAVSYILLPWVVGGGGWEGLGGRIRMRSLSSSRSNRLCISTYTQVYVCTFLPAIFN